jgi:hypothetical protein
MVLIPPGRWRRLEEGMDRSVPRIGAWAGWIALAGILGYHLVLVILAGQRVSGTSDLAAIKAYYGQSIVAVWGVEQFLVLVPVAIFAVAMRETLAIGARGRLLTGVALVAIVVDLPIIATGVAAQAALVSAVQAGESVAGLFRFWDVLYNSGAYVLEATWVLAFGLAMRANPAFPRFMGWLSGLTGVLLAINVFAIWVGIPDAATLPSAFLLSAWFAGASVGLRRVAATA